MYPKWDAPEPITVLTVDVEGTSGGNVEQFSQDKRSRPSGARAAKKDEIRELVGYRGESNGGVYGYDAKRVATQMGIATRERPNRD
ncbi:hypothetical protein Tco_1131412 [Tanacetum coccineum]